MGFLLRVRISTLDDDNPGAVSRFTPAGEDLLFETFDIDLEPVNAARFGKSKHVVERQGGDGGLANGMALLPMLFGDIG